MQTIYVWIRPRGLAADALIGDQYFTDEDRANEVLASHRRAAPEIWVGVQVAELTQHYTEVYGPDADARVGL